MGMILRLASFRTLTFMLAMAPAARATLRPLCTPDQLSLGFDSENGNFDGMSHSGTLLVLRNLGPKPCRMPSFPVLGFLDENGKKLNISARHEGTAPPPHLAVGAEATAGLRWVSAPVFTNGICLKIGRLSVSWPGGTVMQALTVSICGPGGGPANVTQAPLATDPVLPHG